jgi:hypothetical protein
MDMAHFQSASVMSALLLLVACGEAAVPNPGIGPNGELPVIARPFDQGTDEEPLSAAQPAVVYDPEGCQIWLIDDGAETYSGRRLDPETGLPICNDQYPPGTVVRDYRVNDIADWVPRDPYGPLVGVLAE